MNRKLDYAVSRFVCNLAVAISLCCHKLYLVLNKNDINRYDNVDYYDERTIKSLSTANFVNRKGT